MTETLNIQNLVNQPEEFEKKLSELKDLILKNFSQRNDMCVVEVDGEDLEMSYGRLLLNLFLLSLFKGRGMKITKRDLFLKPSVSGDDIQAYLDYVLTRIKVDEIDFDSYRQSVYEFLNQTSDISAETNVLAGNTIDLLDFINVELNDPEAANLFSAPDISNLQFPQNTHINYYSCLQILSHPNKSIISFIKI